MGIQKQPLGSIKLTNVSLVKYKTKGRKFEIACYKNKVLEYRNKVEKDIQNVLQINQVFINVSKGQLPSQQELYECFGTLKVDDIISIIIEKGELQVSEKERNLIKESLLKDVCHLIVTLTINLETKRPFTIQMIEKLLSDIHFNINTTKQPKILALEAIREIQQSGLVQMSRCLLRILLNINLKDAKKLDFKQYFLTLEREEWDSTLQLEGLVEPGNVRTLNELMEREKIKTLVQVLDQIEYSN